MAYLQIPIKAMTAQYVLGMEKCRTWCRRTLRSFYGHFGPLMRWPWVAIRVRCNFYKSKLTTVAIVCKVASNLLLSTTTQPYRLWVLAIWKIDFFFYTVGQQCSWLCSPKLSTQDSRLRSPLFHLFHRLLAQQVGGPRWKKLSTAGSWHQPPSIHHNQRQQSAQLGPRNTQGHSLIVNTVKTQRREGGVDVGRWRDAESFGGVLGRDGGAEGEKGQIAGGPISSLMASKRGNMREHCPVKQVTQGKAG